MVFRLPDFFVACFFLKNFKKNVFSLDLNYSGPYRIVEVRRNCTCPSYVDEVNMINPPEREPHIPLVFSGPDGKGIFYLNGFNEQMLLSLNKTFCGHKKEFDYDRIIILAQDRPIQGILF